MDGVAHDVGDVVVPQGVDDLAAAPAADDQVGGAQDPQVLAHERLRHAEGVDEVVDAALARRSARGAAPTRTGRREGAEELGGLVEPYVVASHMPIVAYAHVCMQ